MADVRVGFSDAFFLALTKLPPGIQAKVNKLVLKFQSDPESSGLNYEKLNAAKDGSMRSLRVDQAYRVILAAPQSGNVYLFLWVDHHDKAYDWATRHTCQINPNTGTIQLYTLEIETVDAEHIEPKVDVGAAPVFEKLKDRHLQKLGVPDDRLSMVREVTSEDKLDQIQELLPNEAYEGLFLYLAGESYESIIAEREVDEAAQYDVANFAEALERVQSQARFVVPKDEQELTEMLNASMDKWRVFLHPSQRRLVNGDKNGATRVLGGAGTGKTVVAMHRAKWLAQHSLDGDKKILFTTFTKNLAIDIAQNLRRICTPEQMQRIEVVNLDRWVQQFLRVNAYDYEVVFDSSRLNSHWRRAISEKPPELDLPDSFFQEEWQQVIQPQACLTLNDYKRASRTGRGTRLSREQRVQIWTVFEEYRRQLNRNRQKETDDAYRDAAQLIREQELSLPYASIIVDEAQDMGNQAFHLLRVIVPEGKNDLFIVGDAHQRIYGRNKVVLSRCGVNIRGRSRKLKINYRTTDEIRKWAVALLDGREIDDLDDGQDDNKLYKSLTHGAPPVIERFDNSEQQAQFIHALLEKGDIAAGATCVVARTNKEVATTKDHLEGLGVKTSVIKHDAAEDESDDVLKLATMHRVKGLEFDQVILASMNAGLVPLPLALQNKGDQVSLDKAETEERSLVYVAITRARKSSFVLSYGQPSSWL
ncbi:MAG: AAA family ATPase [Planctomycetales bacterium]|nr:AAA family ATPase [Planctomycetales bacterium]